MKILVLAHAYPRQRGDFAGAFIHRLNSALLKRSHDITVIAPADENSWGREELDGVEVMRIRYAPTKWQNVAYKGTMDAAVRRPRGALAVASLILRQASIVRGFRRKGVKIVHSHWWIPGGLTQFMSYSGIPHLLTLHGTDIRIMESSLPARLVARRVIKGATTVTTVSNFLAEKVSMLTGITRSKIKVLPMPTEIDGGFESAGGGVVVTVGRLTAQKRVHILLKALQILRHGGRELQLKVIGDGPERDRLLRQATDLGIQDSVEFVGEVSPNQIASLVRSCDVFAFPAVDEGYGLAAAEALMLGIPVVAARSGGVIDTVPERGAGRLVEPDNPNALARAVEAVLTDSDARSKAREVGKSLREKLSADRVAQEYESLYREIAAGEVV